MTRKADPGQELSAPEAKKLVIDEIKKISPRGAVAFSGGEFLLREDALELVRYASGQGLFVVINTNGVLFDKKKAKELKKAAGTRFLLAFSIDSVDKKQYRMLRDGDLKTIQKAAKVCMKQDIGFFAMVTISRKNLSTVGKTLEFLQENKIPILRSPFVPRGSGCNFRELMFDSNDMEKTIFPVLRDNYLSYVSYTPFFADPEKVRAVLDNAGFSLAGLGCQAARGFIAVSAEGNVAPCVQMLDSSSECGNVRKKPLSEIVLENPVMISIRERKGFHGKCGKCRYLVSCGGCRAMAYYTSGDPLSEDPSCFFNPAEGKPSVHEQKQNEGLEKFVKDVSGYAQFRDLFG